MIIVILFSFFLCIYSISPSIFSLSSYYVLQMVCWGTFIDLGSPALVPATIAQSSANLTLLPSSDFSNLLFLHPQFQALPILCQQWVDYIHKEHNHEIALVFYIFKSTKTNSYNLKGEHKVGAKPRLWNECVRNSSNDHKVVNTKWDKCWSTTQICHTCTSCYICAGL